MTTSTTSATTTTSPAKVVLAVSGHGWGHGLGMSQWGAYGYAKHGWTYDAILAHYYKGTTIGPAPVSTVRALLAQKAKTVLASTAPWSVADATGTKTVLDPGAVTLKPKLALKGKALLPPLTFVGKQPIAVDGKPYRGRLVVTSDGKRVQVVDVVALESYLKGVVPSEMPFDWPAQALQAQAVAARSYALANLTKNRDFDLYSDTRDQVYGGVGAESPTTSDAIVATKGKVVLYKGKVADTLFFSTSGGRTASSLEATGDAVPYLVSVADPYDNISPVHDWGPVLFDGTKVAAQLNLPGSLSDLTTVDGAVRARHARHRGRCRGRPDDRHRRAVPCAARASVDLVHRRPLLAPAGGQYGDVRRRPDAERPCEGSRRGRARIESAGEGLGVRRGPDRRRRRHVLDGREAGRRDAIPSLVRLDPGGPREDRGRTPGRRTGTSAGIAGSERPAVAGAPVQLQKQAGTLWTTISSTVADGGGTFAFSGTIQPGSYRVRCAPAGLAAGLSATFQVP